MKLLRTALISCTLSLPAISYAAGEVKEDSKPHCEKTKDGKTIHVHEAKTRRECKKKGGRWVKGHKSEKDDHKHDRKHEEGKGHHGH